MRKILVSIYLPDETEDQEVFYLDDNIERYETLSTITDRMVEYASENGLVYDELDWEILGEIA